MEFKDRIKELRMKKDMSQTQLAALLNKGDSAIRMWELGKSKPDMDTVLQLCDIFKCSIDYLFGKSKGITFDVERIMEYTGLNAMSINYLNFYANDIDNKIFIRLINELIDNQKLLNLLVEYLYVRYDMGFRVFISEKGEELEIKQNQIPILLWRDDGKKVTDDEQVTTVMSIDKTILQNYLLQDINTELKNMYNQQESNKCFNDAIREKLKKLEETRKKNEVTNNTDFEIINEPSDTVIPNLAVGKNQLKEGDTDET